MLLRSMLFVLLMLPVYALAATYSVSGTWTDPTPSGPGYSPQYDAEHRVNGGAVTPIGNLPTPNFSTAITANEGDTIEVRVRNRNQQNEAVSAWSSWFAATAPVVPVTPLDPTGVVITVTPQ